MEESAQECSEAQRVDPEGKYSLCQWTFAHLQDYETALRFIADNTSPTLKKSLRADMLMRMGDREAARTQLADASDELAAMDIQKACLAMEQPAELAGWIADRHEQYSAWPDPEAIYWYSALLSDCGFPDEAISYLELSLDRNYCVPAALDNDPLWDPIRDDPRFLAQRQRAIDCHQRFMAERAG